jgi:hypothetical protein
MTGCLCLPPFPSPSPSGPRSVHHRRIVVNNIYFLAKRRNHGMHSLDPFRADPGEGDSRARTRPYVDNTKAFTRAGVVVHFIVLTDGEPAPRISYCYSLGLVISNGHLLFR